MYESYRDTQSEASSSCENPRAADPSQWEPAAESARVKVLRADSVRGVRMPSGLGCAAWPLSSVVTRGTWGHVKVWEFRLRQLAQEGGVGAV